MKPSLLTPNDIDAYLNAGHWTRETMVDRYNKFAARVPDGIACRDSTETYSWSSLKTVTDCLAVSLIELGIPRDATAIVQTPSNCRELVLRVAFKKAGIIGVFIPLQWRRRELIYVFDRINPSLVAVATSHVDSDTVSWFNEFCGDKILLALEDTPRESWIKWSGLVDRQASVRELERLPQTTFKFDEVSLVTASSGTSGLAKLCEWPEGAQVCQSRVLCERMQITDGDKVGIFAPTAGAAGLMMWMVSWTVPCVTVFPSNYRPSTLLNLVEDETITVGTTVPVILVRLTDEALETRNLSSLRLMRVGTAAADVSVARSFEIRSGCRVVVASGSMECTGFGHAHVNEPMELRLNGSVGLPLDGCLLRIEDQTGAEQPVGTSGELKVSAPFSSSGYWKAPEESKAAWSDGWYSTGDIGVLDQTGRLTLLGRLKDTINRSGHKILPLEIEREITLLADVVECSVVAVPDREYGEVPCAFVRLRAGCTLDVDGINDALKKRGLASYKFPHSFVEVARFPRINDNKVDKKALLATLK